MAKYVIDLTLPDVKNAGPKARGDVNHFLEKQGYKSIKLYFPQKYIRGITPLLNKLISFFYTIKWIFVLKKRGVVLIQHPIPHDYIRSFVFCKKWKQLKIIILIHDLEHFRKGFSIEKDLVQFKGADVIISHNSIMSAMIKRPYLTSKIIDLQVFDYKVKSNKEYSSAPVPALQKGITVNYAGNLAPDKSGFIYKMPSSELNAGVRMILYGINYDSRQTDGMLHYAGVFAPDDSYVLEGEFGLIWDGSSLKNCEGIFGEYLKINNPHKLSLYLSASKPVIIWEHAAAARFVKEKNVGITIQSLEELGDKLKHLGNEEIKSIKENAQLCGRNIRDGYFIRQAVEEAERV